MVLSWVLVQEAEDGNGNFCLCPGSLTAETVEVLLVAFLILRFPELPEERKIWKSEVL